MSARWKTVIAGIGFLSDSYDLFIINMVLRVLSTLYPPLASPAMASPISTAALIGAVAGQLVCGSLADTVGRRAIFILTIVLIVVGSIGSAAVPSGEGGDAMMASAAALSASLAVWRGVLGFGVGGEYPLSATVTSEGSDNGSSRGRNLGLVFSMQGVGNLLASVVMITLLSMPISLEAVWRSALALGALPGLLTVYWRWKMEESEHFVRAVAVTDRDALPGARLELVQQPQALLDPHAVALKIGPHPTTIQRQDSLEVEDGLEETVPDDEFTPLSPPMVTHTPTGTRSSASSSRASSPLPSSHTRDTWAAWRDALVSRLRTTLQQVYEFRWTLLGTAGSWLIFDIVFYANGLSSASVLHATGIGADSPADAPDDAAARAALKQQAVGSAVLAFMSLPGYALGVFFIDSMGRRRMQLMGFAAMAGLFLILAVSLDTLVKHYEYLFVFLYGLTFFFSNFGPNMTTFIVPAEAFPTRARATGHGISAASGKMGAAIGAALMPLLVSGGAGMDVRGLMNAMWMCAAVCLTGFAWTWYLTKETGGVDLELLDAQQRNVSGSAR